jgi:hypothetical protein
MKAIALLVSPSSSCHRLLHLSGDGLLHLFALSVSFFFFAAVKWRHHQWVLSVVTVDIIRPAGSCNRRFYGDADALR